MNFEAVNAIQVIILNWLQNATRDQNVLQSLARNSLHVLKAYYCGEILLILTIK